MRLQEETFMCWANNKAMLISNSKHSSLLIFQIRYLVTIVHSWYYLFICFMIILHFHSFFWTAYTIWISKIKKKTTLKCIYFCFRYARLNFNLHHYVFLVSSQTLIRYFSQSIKMNKTQPFEIFQTGVHSYIYQLKR